MKWFQRQQIDSKLPNGVSERDAELLSAYLDGQLSQREQQQLEQRLERTPALQTLLAELRLTRTLLRSQPLLRAPRNFTLTPQMAGVRVPGLRQPRSSAFSALRLASVLATIFFVIVLVGDLYASRLQPAMMPAADAAQQAIPFGKGGGGGGGEPESLPGSVEAPAEVQPEAMATEAPIPTGAPVAAPAATQAREFNIAQATPTEEPILGLAPPAPAEAQKVAPTEAMALPPPEGEAVQQAAPPTVSPVRWLLRALLILLGLLAVGTGAAAFLARKRAWG